MEIKYHHLQCPSSHVKWLQRQTQGTGWKTLIHGLQGTRQMDTNEERPWKVIINWRLQPGWRRWLLFGSGLLASSPQFFKKSQKAGVLCETFWFLNISSFFRFRAPQANTQASSTKSVTESMETARSKVKVWRLDLTLALLHDTTPQPGALLTQGQLQELTHAQHCRQLHKSASIALPPHKGGFHYSAATESAVLPELFMELDIQNNAFPMFQRRTRWHGKTALYRVRHNRSASWLCDFKL